MPAEGLGTSDRHVAMKAAEIDAGQCYTDGMGVVRKVVDLGPPWAVVSHGQEVEYCVLARPGGLRRDDREDTTVVTLRSFARWAKSRAQDSSMRST